MRVNVYAEELTDRVEIVSKTVDGRTFTGLRFYLELPMSTADGPKRGPFMHRPDDDDSAAVTFWGEHAELSDLIWKALRKVNEHQLREQATATGDKPRRAYRRRAKPADPVAS